MNTEIINTLSIITDEEKAILSGKDGIEKNIYTTAQNFIIDSKKMLQNGKLIDIRPHTRFIHFPCHRHNYIEIVYMIKGSTTHIINGKEIVLNSGELLFLNQNAYQEILPASENDIAVNFIVLPEFFDVAFSMINTKDENILRKFMINSLTKEKSGIDFLHFLVSDILPVQNLVENMIWSIINKNINSRTINQITMGLLFMQILNHTDKISNQTANDYEHETIFYILQYIEENYKEASLNELSKLLNKKVPF